MDDDEHSEEVESYYGSDDDGQDQLPSLHPEEEDEDEDAHSASASDSAPAFHILSTQQLEQWVTANNQIDVGCAGNVVWSVSSAKHGNGVRHLMHHHDLHTYWQSDGVLPHVIRIRLGQLTPVEAIAVYVNSAVDQSYSPRVIKVKAGTHDGDMTEVAKADIGPGQERGWVLLELGDGLVSDKTNEEAAGQGGKETARKSDEQPPHSPSPSAAADKAGETARPFSFRDVAAVVGNSSAPTAPTLLWSAAHTAADRWLWCTVIDISICENQFNGRDCHLRGICLTGPRYEELEKGLLDDGAGGLDRNVGASVKSILHGDIHADETEADTRRGRTQTQDWLLR